jgi:Flp pilus assembly protein TadB
LFPLAILFVIALTKGQRSQVPDSLAANESQSSGKQTQKRKETITREVKTLSPKVNPDKKEKKKSPALVWLHLIITIVTGAALNIAYQVKLDYFPDFLNTLLATLFYVIFVYIIPFIAGSTGYLRKLKKFDTDLVNILLPIVLTLITFMCIVFFFAVE